MRKYLYAGLGVIFIGAITELVLPDTFISNVSASNPYTIRFISMAESSGSLLWRKPIEIIDDPPYIEDMRSPSNAPHVARTNAALLGKISEPKHWMIGNDNVVSSLNLAFIYKKIFPSSIFVCLAIDNPTDVTRGNVTRIGYQRFRDYWRSKYIFKSVAFNSEKCTLHCLHRVCLSSQMLSLFKGGIGPVAGRFGVVLSDFKSGLFVSDGLPSTQPHQCSENPQETRDHGNANGRPIELPGVFDQIRRFSDQQPVVFGFISVLLPFGIGIIAGYLLNNERLIIGAALIGCDLLLLGLLIWLS